MIKNNLIQIYLLRFTSGKQTVVMTGHQVAAFIAEMETVAHAEVKPLAIKTDSATHPRSITKNIEPVGPYVPKTIAIDISLTIVSSHTEAS